MNVIIRNAAGDDLEAMVELLHLLFSIEVDFIPDHDRQRTGLKMMLDGCGKHRCIKVACVNNRTVGMCTAQIVISTAAGAMAAIVEDLVILPTYRNKGVGQRLMAVLEQWAVSHGATRLQLLADRNNTDALAFYSAVGWQPTQLICLRKIGIDQ